MDVFTLYTLSSSSSSSSSTAVSNFKQLTDQHSQHEGSKLLEDDGVAGTVAFKRLQWKRKTALLPVKNAEFFYVMHLIHGETVV